jgi:hypothetical protein
MVLRLPRSRSGRLERLGMAVVLAGSLAGVPDSELVRLPMF